jgi:hypothetical protein
MGDLRIGYARLDAIPRTELALLSTKKIFFGHKSVGQNIIDGIKAVMERNPGVRLNILETSRPGDFGNPVFAHSPIGQNRDPESKINEFKKILESGIGQTADIAMFKFCFVDIDRNTDIESLLNDYGEAIASLNRDYPNLRIVTFTVPLTNQPRGIKPLIKRILGMMPPYKDDNKKRNLFNAELRRRFGDSVFDLAGIEATRPDGNKVSFKDGDGTYDLMNPAYTDDGGHLNELGRQLVAIDFLIYLLSLNGD